MDREVSVKEAMKLWIELVDYPSISVCHNEFVMCCWVQQNISLGPYVLSLGEYYDYR